MASLTAQVASRRAKAKGFKLEDEFSLPQMLEL